MSEKKCVIGYTTRTYGRGFVYDKQLSELKECCESFKNKFKNRTIFFTTIDNEERCAFLSPYQPINFCPFCGAKIELKEIKVLCLK